MTRPRALALLLVLALLPSCATMGLQPMTPTMSPERAGLAPEYRLFYDALREDGDWILIEPYGYVFRPDVNFVAWQPYEQGFWVPSDVYGWVWVSTEPFGWATFHYGRWLYDAFQGWVWLPGLEWAPSWVSWEMAGPYIGWSPLIGGGVDPSQIPGGITRWTPMASLGTTDLTTHLVTREQVGSALAQREEVQNVGESDGVRFNKGPAIELVERVTGPLPRARVSDAPLGAPRDVRPGAKESAPASEAEELRRAGADLARVARGFAKASASAPTSIGIVRAPLAEPPGEAPERPLRPRGKVTAPDSVRAR